jgi:hypothetical protein
MVAINEILLPECTGERCGGDNDICTDSRIHHCNAENRAPVTRNHRSAPVLGRWLTRDPIGYQGGINFYQHGDNDLFGAFQGNPVRGAQNTQLFAKDFAHFAATTKVNGAHHTAQWYKRGPTWVDGYLIFPWSRIPSRAS